MVFFLRQIADNAYIRTSDQMYTAFQADGSLWQWKRISFNLPNAVPAFQRIAYMIL